MMTITNAQAHTCSHPSSTPDRSINKGAGAVTFLWILLGALYFVALISLGVMTFRRGHYFLFWIGIIFPILWIFGALMSPTSRAAEAA
jgi:ABC-type multidrug transport system permease subunit